MFLRLGCDPEVFLKDAKGNPVSAIGKIGGTKARPKPIKELNSYYAPDVGIFALQEDNVALEYNTPAASYTDHWVTYHQKINSYIDDLLKPMGLKRHIVPCVEFPESELQTPKAWVFGCEPDYDAWNLQINPRPESNNRFLRSAGGHIHVGYAKPSKISSIELVRLLDVFVGMPMMVAEEPNKRKELYGRAGACRFKPFGVEYRTPSNFWTAKDSRIKWIFLQAHKAFSTMGSSRSLDLMNNRDIPEIINKNDRSGAKTFLEKNGVEPCPL